MTAKCNYFWKSQSGNAIQYMKCFNGKSLKLDGGKKLTQLYVIIPGNPGCIQFYEKFAEELCNLTNNPVWGISHSGHARCGSGMKHPEKTDCGLQKQIEHKVQFLEEDVFPVAEKVFLIGHSIGTYIILQIMERLFGKYKNEVRGILLLPTIEKLLLSPNGQKIVSLVHNERWLTPIVSATLNVLHLLPNAVLDCILPFFVETKEEFILNTIKDNISPHVVMSAMYMGLTEMLEVTEREDHILDKHIDNLVFYYGATDKWCPVSLYESMVKTYGQRNNIMLCQQNIPHAFVLTKSLEMAKIVASFEMN
uniref:Lipid droplet-associated hydrolase n=1 Tax=Phallusia mammillata TaxID=59560 RepID=A0A6F9DKA4_9ASCI|nr:UPF0554 protein C2orf43 homolog [Phallusia mammillata]